MTYTPRCRFTVPAKYPDAQHRRSCERERGHEGAHFIHVERVYFDDNGNVLGFGP